MSRTHRKQPYSNPRYFWWKEHLKAWGEDSPFCYSMKGLVVKAERDGNSYREWTGSVKKATRRERRRDWKKSEHAILRSADPEEIDVPRLEKKYLGEIWNWD